MLAQTRELYDIETLWTVGPEFDDKMKEEEDPFAYMFEDPDLSTPSNKSEKVHENVLTLSDNVEYIYDNEEKSQVEYKFTKKPEVETLDMENVAGWHSYDKNDKKNV